MTRPATPAQRPDLEALRPVDVHDLVRLGRERDGGYVVSRRAIEATRFLVGLGVNDEWSFEEAFLAEAPRTRLVLVDGTVGSGRYAWHALERAARASPAPRTRTRAAGPTGVARGSLLRCSLATLRGVPRP